VEVAVHRKEEVLRVVSHDLRNPLNTIRLAAHEMVAEGSVPALAAVIDRAAGTMYELIEAVLEVARFEQGGIVLRKSRVSISGLVEDFLVDVQPRGATIDVEWGADPSDTVYVDRNRMRQVLTNLVTNAIQHSPPHECVRVGVERITGGHRFFVQDRGPGIAANDVPRVFDRYFTSSSGGTGMGLMIAKAIVESHKGTIGVDTEIGQGSRFWFTVPEDTAA
jgi:signal transduction histidine kinase